MFGAKRPLLSNDYYPAFNRQNLELVTEGIERITPSGIVTVDGRLREVDTIVFATGFQTTKYLSAIDVTGRGGLRIEVAFGPDYPVAVVYAPDNDDVVCFEPMTAPTNPFEGDTPLRWAEPGETVSAGFEVRVARTRTARSRG